MIKSPPSFGNGIYTAMNAICSKSNGFAKVILKLADTSKILYHTFGKKQCNCNS